MSVEWNFFVFTFPIELVRFGSLLFILSLLIESPRLLPNMNVWSHAHLWLIESLWVYPLSHPSTHPPIHPPTHPVILKYVTEQELYRLFLRTRWTLSHGKTTHSSNVLVFFSHLLFCLFVRKRCYICCRFQAPGGCTSAIQSPLFHSRKLLPAWFSAFLRRPVLCLALCHFTLGISVQPACVSLWPWSGSTKFSASLCASHWDCMDQRSKQWAAHRGWKLQRASGWRFYSRRDQPRRQHFHSIESHLIQT